MNNSWQETSGLSKIIEKDTVTAVEHLTFLFTNVNTNEQN